MKVTIRTIVYSIFHICLALAMAINSQEETALALSIASIALVVYLIVRPSKEEYINCIAGRTFFYWSGAIVFFLLAFSGRIESVGSWENVDSFVLWLKFLGCILLLKAFGSLLLRSSYQRKRRLSRMHDRALEKGADSFKISNNE